MPSVRPIRPSSRLDISYNLIVSYRCYIFQHPNPKKPLLHYKIHNSTLITIPSNGTSVEKKIQNKLCFHVNFLIFFFRSGRRRRR